MKKLLLVGTLLGSLFLTGCSTKHETKCMHGHFDNTNTGGWVCDKTSASGPVRLFAEEWK